MKRLILAMIGGAAILALAAGAVTRAQDENEPEPEGHGAWHNAPDDWRGGDWHGGDWHGEWQGRNWRGEGPRRPHWRDWQRRGHRALLCDERLPRMIQMRLGRIEEVVRPTPQQDEAFSAFKAAALRAGDIMRSGCPTERHLTPTGRLEAVEKLLEARLQAVKTVRPALEAFYRVLTDEQKARFNAIGMRSGHGLLGSRQERWRYWHGDEPSGGDTRKDHPTPDQTPKKGDQTPKKGPTEERL